MAACESDSEDSTETVLVCRGDRRQQSGGLASGGGTVQDRKAKVTGWLKNSNADENENLLPPPQGVRQRQRPPVQSRSLQKTSRRQPAAAATAAQHSQSRTGPPDQKGDVAVPNDDAEHVSETAKRLQALEALAKEEGREEDRSGKRKDVGEGQTRGGDKNYHKVVGMSACSSVDGDPKSDSKHYKSNERCKETRHVKVPRDPDKERAKNTKQHKSRASCSSQSTVDVKHSERRESHRGVSLDSSDCASVSSVRSSSSGTSHSHRGRQRSEGSDPSRSDTSRTSNSLKSKGATSKSSSTSSSCPRDATSSSSSSSSTTTSSTSSSVKTSECSRHKSESENSQKHSRRMDSIHSSSLPVQIEDKSPGRQNSSHSTSCTEERKVNKTSKTFSRLHSTRTDTSGQDKAKVQGAQRSKKVELPSAKKGKENKLGAGLGELFAPDVQIEAGPEQKHNTKKHPASTGQGIKSTAVAKERKTQDRPRVCARVTVEDSANSPRKRLQNAASSQKQQQPSSGGAGKAKGPEELNPPPKSESPVHVSGSEEAERRPSFAASLGGAQNEHTDSVSAAVSPLVHPHSDAVPDSTPLAQTDAEHVKGDELEDLSELSDDSEDGDSGAFEAMFPELAQDGNTAQNETEGKDMSLVEEGDAQDEIEVENMLDDIALGIENGEYSDLKTTDRRDAPGHATEVNSAQDNLIRTDDAIDAVIPESKAAAVPEENVKTRAEPEVSQEADALASGGEMTRPREGNTHLAEATELASPHRNQPVVEGTPVVVHSEMTHQKECVSNPTHISSDQVSSVASETVRGVHQPLEPVNNDTEEPNANEKLPTVIAPGVEPSFSFWPSEPRVDSPVERRKSSTDPAESRRSLSSEVRGVPGCTYSPISSDEEGEIVSDSGSESAGEEGGGVELALACSPVSSVDGEPGCSPISSDGDDGLASPRRRGSATEREDENSLGPVAAAESTRNDSVEQTRDESRQEGKQEEACDIVSNVAGLMEDVSLQKNEVGQDEQIDEEKPLDLKSEEQCAVILEENCEHQVKELGSLTSPVSKIELQRQENTQKATTISLFDATVQHKDSPVGSDEAMTANDTHELSTACLKTADIRRGSPQDAASAEPQHQTATDAPNQEPSRSPEGVDPELPQAFPVESNEADSDTDATDRADDEVTDAVDGSSACEADLDGGLILTEGFDEIQRLLRELSDAVPSVPEFGTARSILDSIREVVDLQESNRSPHVQPFLASCALAVRGILCMAYTVVGAADEEELQTRRPSDQTEAESHVPDTDANDAPEVAGVVEQTVEAECKVGQENTNAVGADVSERKDQDSGLMQVPDALEAFAGSKEASDASSKGDSEQVMSEPHLTADLITEETSSKNTHKVKEEPDLSDLQIADSTSQFSNNEDEDQTDLGDSKVDVEPIVCAAEEALSSSVVYAEGNDSGFSSVDHMVDAGDAAKLGLWHCPGGASLAVPSPATSEVGFCHGAVADDNRPVCDGDAGVLRVGGSVECAESEQHAAPDPAAADFFNSQAEKSPPLGVPEDDSITTLEKQPSAASGVPAPGELEGFTPENEDVNGRTSSVETSEGYQAPGGAAATKKKRISGSDNKRKRRLMLLEGIFGKRFMSGKNKEKVSMMWLASQQRISRNICVCFPNEADAGKYRQLNSTWASSRNPLYNDDLLNFRLLSGFGDSKNQARLNQIEDLPLNPFGVNFNLLTGLSFASKKGRKRARNQARKERRRAENNEQTSTNIGAGASQEEDDGVTSGPGDGSTSTSCDGKYGVVNEGHKPAVGSSSLPDKTHGSENTSNIGGAADAGDGNLEHSTVDTPVSEGGAETDAAAPKATSRTTAVSDEESTLGNMAASEEVVNGRAAGADGRVLSAGDLVLKMAAESGEYDLEEGEIVSESSDESSGEISSVESGSPKSRRRRSGSPRRRGHFGKRSSSPAGDKRKRRRSSSRHSRKRRHRRVARSPRSRSRSPDRRPRSRSSLGTPHKRRGLPAGEESDSMDEWETISSVGFADSCSLSDISPAKSTLVEVPIIDMGPVLNPGAILRTKCKADNEAFASGKPAGSKGKGNTVKNDSEPFPMPNSHRDEKKDTSSEDEMDSEVILPTKTEPDEATKVETKEDQGTNEDKATEVETKKEIASSDSTTSVSVPGVSAFDKLENWKKKHYFNVLTMKQRFAEFKRRCGLTAPAMAEALSDALELPEDRPAAEPATKKKKKDKTKKLMQSTKGPKVEKPGESGGSGRAVGDIPLTSSAAAGESSANQSLSEVGNTCTGVISGTISATNESNEVGPAVNVSNAAAAHPAGSSQAYIPVEGPEEETREETHEKEAHGLPLTLTSTSSVYSSVGQTNNEDPTSTCDTSGEQVGVEPATPLLTSADEVGGAQSETLGELAKSCAKETSKLIGCASLSDKAEQSVPDASVDSKAATTTPPKFQPTPPKMCEIPFIGTVEAGSHLFQTSDVRDAEEAPVDPQPAASQQEDTAGSSGAQSSNDADAADPPAEGLSGAVAASAGEDAGTPQEAAGAGRSPAAGSDASETEVDEVRVLEDEPDAEDGEAPQPTAAAVRSYKRPAADWETPPAKRTRVCPPRPARELLSRREAAEPGSVAGGPRSSPASAGARAHSPVTATPQPLSEAAGELSGTRSGWDAAHPGEAGPSRHPSCDSADRRRASTPTKVNTPPNLASVVTVPPNVVSGHVASVVTVPPNVVSGHVASVVTVSSRAGAAVHPPETPEPVYSTNCARPPRAGRSAKSGRAEDRSRSRSGERCRVEARPEEAGSPKCPDCGQPVKAAYGQILLLHRRSECQAFHDRGKRAPSPRPQLRTAGVICAYCDREVRSDVEIHSRTCWRTALQCWFCKRKTHGNLAQHLDMECTRNQCVNCGARVNVPFFLHNQHCAGPRPREVRSRRHGPYRPRR